MLRTKQNKDVSTLNQENLKNETIMGLYSKQTTKVFATQL